MHVVLVLSLPSWEGKQEMVWGHGRRKNQAPGALGCGGFWSEIGFAGQQIKTWL